jgi:hypothetical protein
METVVAGRRRMIYEGSEGRGVVKRKIMGNNEYLSKRRPRSGRYSQGAGK